MAYFIYFIPLLVSAFILIFFPNIGLCHEIDATFLLEPGKDVKIEFDYGSLRSNYLETIPPDLEDYLSNSTLDEKVRISIE